ncbi:MAG: helix-turn-helix domain-containing protein [Actinomycetota bacterium]
MASTDGFVRLPNWLIDDSNLSLNELAVYIVLLRFRNPKTGKCFPGMTTIADRARMSKRSVIRAIDSLEQRSIIRVQRRSTITENIPNVYDVSVPTETREHVWATSARGQRIPKRSPSDSESPGPEVEAQPSDSESPASDKTVTHPVTRSHPKKIQKKKIQQQAETPTFAESGSESFTFDSSQGNGATEGQVAYLNDLAIHLGYETGGGIPNDLQLQRWRKLTVDEANAQIRGYLKALGRPDEIIYPQAGDPEYAALSPAGKQFAESAGDPDSVYDYSRHELKENTA